MILMFLVPFLAMANYDQEGQAFGEQLLHKGFENAEGSLNEMSREWAKQPGNSEYAARTESLQSSFETNYDTGKKGQDPLKGHFAQKNLEATKNKSENQPSLGDAENLLKQKKRFKISPEDEIFKRYQEVSNASVEDEEGVFQKGQPPQETAPQLKDRIVTCRQSAAPTSHSCVKRLFIKAVPQTPIVKTVTAYFTARCYNLVSFIINLKTGQVGVHQCENQGPVKVYVTDPMGEPELPEQTTIELISRQHIGEGGVDFRTGLMTPSESNGFTASFTAFQPKTGKKHDANKNNIRGGQYSWRVTMPRKPVLHEYWEGCEDLERKTVEGFCEIIGNEQEGINESRNIPNYPIPVVREYWSENKSFICGAGRDIDECESLVQQKCQQIDSKCAVEKNNICIEFENTFKCGVPDYLKGDGLEYKNGKLSFLKEQGQVNTGYDAKDFGEAVTQFSALTEMGKKLQDELGGILGNPDDPSVFHGRCSQCRVNLGSFFRDCCKLKGILQGLFGKCNEEEKKLAIAAIKNKRCVKIEGRYCHKKRAGVCLEKRDSYCCYGSQLARIIQEIAHYQLNIPWGDAKNPNCASLTASQLSQIDFDTPYAQAKLAEILAEVQATAQEKFELVQNAVAQLGDVQGKVEELQKSQEAQFNKRLSENEIPKNEHSNLNAKMRRDVIVEEQNVFKEKVRVSEEQRIVDEGKKELALAKKYVQNSESQLASASRLIAGSEPRIENAAAEIARVKTTFSKDSSLQYLKFVNEAYKRAKDSFQLLLNGRISLEKMLTQQRLKMEKLEQTIELADKTAIRKEMEANDVEINRLSQRLILTGGNIGADLKQAARYLESAQKIQRAL